MADLSSIVDLIHPAASGIGIITSDQIFVVFDREIDETTIAGGNFFVTGPDFDTWLGPDLQLFHEAESTGSGETEILQSPGFQGIVQGIISFERLDLATTTVIPGVDTVGSGHLYRTKAIFTPTNRLQSSTEYNVYLSGDEDELDSLQTGISERTVFDTVASGTNVSTAEVDFDGGYIGTVTDIYHVDITATGPAGDAKFTFYRDSDPGSVFGPFRTKRSGVLLSDGVVVEFPEDTYTAGDHWHVVVKPRNVFVGNAKWSFKTGSGSIQTIPDTTATSVLGDPAPAAAVVAGGGATTSFNVLSTDPINGASNVVLPAGEFTASATLSAGIDAGTVTSGVSVLVTTESVTGETPPSGLAHVSPTVAGDVLTIDIGDGQLTQNQLVTITLKNTISDGATSLGSDFSWSFSTQYYPMYCTLRRLRLDIGLFIEQVPDDTINLAIHIASQDANDGAADVALQNNSAVSIDSNQSGIVQIDGNAGQPSDATEL